MKSPYNLLAISFAKRALEAGSREQQRLVELGGELDRLVLVVFTRKSDALPEKFAAGNVVIYGTNSTSKLGMVYRAFRIARRVLAADEMTWVVSSQDPFVTSVIGRILAWPHRVQHHIQLHGDFFSQTVEWYRAPLQSLARWFAVSSLRRAGGVRVVSQRIKKSLVQQGIVTESAVTVLPVQVTLESFLAVGNTRSFSYTAPIRCVFVGRLAPEKNLPLLLSAFISARERGAELTLTIVGTGPMLPQLEETVATAGLGSVVTFEPWTEDVPQLLATADVFTLSSDHEGYALVLLEAMAAGLAVVTTDVGCAGEVMKDGEHGTIVSVGTTEAYANALCALATAPEKITAYAQAGIRTAGDMEAAQRAYGTAWKETFFGATD